MEDRSAVREALEHKLRRHEGIRAVEAAVRQLDKTEGQPQVTAGAGIVIIVPPRISDEQ